MLNNSFLEIYDERISQKENSLLCEVVKRKICSSIEVELEQQKIESETARDTSTHKISRVKRIINEKPALRRNMMTTMSVGNNDETLDKSLLTVSEVDYLEKKDGGMMLDQVTFNSFSFH